MHNANKVAMRERKRLQNNGEQGLTIGINNVFSEGEVKAAKFQELRVIFDVINVGVIIF